MKSSTYRGEKLMEYLAIMGVSAFAVLIGSGLLMAFVLVFSMLFEILTGIDLIRDYIRPFFETLI